MAVTTASIEVLKTYLVGKDSIKRECLEVIDHLQLCIKLAKEALERENYEVVNALLTLPEKE